MDEFQIGDKVAVIDQGLQMLYNLMKSMGENPKPNNLGWVDGILDDGDIMVKFPIGDDGTNGYYQVAPYPRKQVIKHNW